MIKLNGKVVKLNKFPDGTLLLKEKVKSEKAKITWYFNNNEELVALIYLVRHLKQNGIKVIDLDMPYIPNARQDRVKNGEDIFTLKYFADVINWLQFNSVTVLDPHSSVSEALINNIRIRTPENYVNRAIEGVFGIETFFYPDEGAMKRYSTMFNMPYAFGIKKRDWETGQIRGLDISGMTDMIEDKKILIVDDICSRGGTFYYSAKKLKELGANEIYLYVSHCENTIIEGELLTSGLIEKVFTTNSLYTERHKKVEVLNYEDELNYGDVLNYEDEFNVIDRF